MKLSVNNTYVTTKNDTLVMFTHEDFKLTSIPSKLSFVKSIGTEKFFQELKASAYIPSSQNPNLILVPLVKSGSSVELLLRNAAAEALKIARSHKLLGIKLLVSEVFGLDKKQVADRLIEGVMIGGYSFSKYKSSDDTDNYPAQCELLNLSVPETKSISDTITICENVNLCRDMVNDSTESVNPDTIEDFARKIAKHKSVSITVLNERQLKSKKMGLILAVGRAGRYRPRLVVLKYKGNPSSKEWIALVGKGVTFDTGGLNLKNAAGMTDMRYDMAGAATMIHALKCAADLGIKKNVYAVTPLVENAVDSESYKVGDIFTSYSGKTVQVLNTDAEGRLILADALAYTEQVLKPNMIIDAATLTGACLTTFGYQYAALLSNSNELAESLLASSKTSGDDIWRLPFNDAFDQKIKSDIADLSNITTDRKAGTIIGATFLKQFVEHTPWAHLDIASTGWMDQPNGYLGKYATGFGVRLLTDFLRS